MAWDNDLRDALVARLNTLPDIGTVHPRARGYITEEMLAQMLKSTTGTDHTDEFRGVLVRLVTIDHSPAEASVGLLAQVERTYTYELLFALTYNDKREANVSSTEFFETNMIEPACDLFLESSSLGFGINTVSHNYLNAVGRLQVLQGESIGKYHYAVFQIAFKVLLDVGVCD